MDQGIIQCLKLKYRRRQLQHVIQELEICPATTGPQVLHEITVLQAIYWVNTAWKAVSSETISKCFRKSGFSVDDAPSSVSEVVSDADDEDELPLIMHKLARDLFDCEVSELMNLDKEFTTCDTDMSDWDRPALEILAETQETEDTSDTETTAVEDQPPAESPVVPSFSEVCDMTSQIRAWALRNGHEDVVCRTMGLSDCLSEIILKAETVKQTKISDFFQKL